MSVSNASPQGKAGTPHIAAFFEKRPWRLVALLCLVLAAMLLCQRGGYSVDPFGTRIPTARSWYVELALDARPVSVHNENLVKPLSQELSQVRRVQKVFSATMRTKVVFALLVAAGADAQTTESSVRFAVARLLESPVNRSLETADLVILSKSIGRQFRGVKGLDPRTAAGLSHEFLLQTEFSQLFGEPAIYEESRGLVDLFEPDLRLNLQLLADASGHHGDLLSVLGRLASATSLMPAVQLGVVRNFPARVVDLRYSGLDALRMGLTGPELARRSGLWAESDRSAMRTHANREFPARAEVPDLEHLLGRTVQSQGLDQVRLGELAAVNAHPAFLVGVLGTDPSRWRERLPSRSEIERIRADAAQGPLAEQAFRQASVDFVLSNEAAWSRAALEMNRVLASLQKEEPRLQFQLDERQMDRPGYAEDASPRVFLPGAPGRMTLFMCFFVLAMFVVFLPANLPGARFLCCFGFSGFLFSAMAILTELDLSLERFATALGLFVIMGFARELPVARSHLVRVHKVILSERIHVFLLLLTLPVLFSIYVLQYDYSWNEKQHLLTFCLAALAVFLALTVYRPLAPPTIKRFGDQEFSTQSWWLGSLCLIPMLIPVFESKILTLDPPGLVVLGEVDLSEEGLFAQEGVASLREGIAAASGAAALETTVASRAWTREMLIQDLPDAPRRLSPDVLGDILAGAAPLYGHQLFCSRGRQRAPTETSGFPCASDASDALDDAGASNDGEQVIVRLVDTDFKYEWGVESYAHWMDRAFVPMSMLLASNSATGSTLSPTSGGRSSPSSLALAPLRDVLHVSRRQVPERDIRVGGAAVALFAARGALNGPHITPHHEHQALAALSSELSSRGVPESHQKIVTNRSAHQSDRGKTQDLTWIISLLVLGSGALFFGTVRGAVQTYFSYLVAYGIAKPIMIFSYTFSGIVYLVSDLELQIAAMSVSLGLLAIWGHISADTNESRKRNLPLEKAFVTFFCEIQGLHKLLLGLWSIVFFFSLNYQPFRFLSAILLSTLVALLLFPHWVLCWAVVEEFLHRWYLRCAITFQIKFQNRWNASVFFRTFNRG